MKQYVCSICGYVYDEAVSGLWEALPADWKCPICKAGKEAFRVREEAPQPQAQLEKPHVETELSPMEMSIICSNLARGCEKQYLFPQMEAFQKLADFFRSQVTPPAQATREDLPKLVEQDLEVGFPYGKDTAAAASDRGALRCQVWSEKVTRMLQSLLTRYAAEGEAMLQNTGVWVCSVCGFVYVGDEPPQLCPVCKVPAWKFDRAERRA